METGNELAGAARLQQSPPRSAGPATIEEWFESRVHALQIPGATLAVCKAGKLFSVDIKPRQSAFRRVFSTVTPAPIGCLSTVFTAHAVLALVQQGKLELEDFAADFFDGSEPYVAPLRGVRIGHLLAYTSGLQAVRDGGSRRASGNASRFQLTSISEPGRVYSHGAVGYMFLGHVLHRVTNMSWEDSIQELVLKPAGCAQSARITGRPSSRSIGLFQHDRNSFKAARATHFYLSAEDLCRFGRAHLHHQDSVMSSFGYDFAAVVDRMYRCPSWQPAVGSTPVQGFAWKHTASGQYGHIGFTDVAHVSLSLARSQSLCFVVQSNSNSPQLYQEVTAKLGLSAISSSIFATFQHRLPEASITYSGTFARHEIAIDIEHEEAGTFATARIRSDTVSPRAANRSERVRLKQLAPRVFMGEGEAARSGPFGRRFYVEFLGPTEGRFEFIRLHDLIFSAAKERAGVHPIGASSIVTAPHGG